MKDMPTFITITYPASNLGFRRGQNEEEEVRENESILFNGINKVININNINI